MNEAALIEPHAPSAQGFLDGPVAEAASVALFAAGSAAFVGILPLELGHQAILGVGGAALGAVGVGIERGQHQVPSWATALGLGALGGGVHTAVAAALGAPVGVGLAARALVLVALTAALARAATRLDRREAGWRAACRAGPPTGATSLGTALALRPLPLPLRLVGWLLLPVDLLARGAALSAILLYQLTLSRLMPPACRYEPTCSRYGFQAYCHHGFLRATLLTSWRLLRCSPVGSGGYDPMVVTPRRGETTERQKGGE